MSAFKTYLNALRDLQGVGVEETSGYGALQNLLDSAGSTLKPNVRCILHPQGKGAGIPDGALFTRDQLQTLGRDFNPQSALQLMPARGAIEVKGLNADLSTLIESEQVAKYLAKYRQVLCTNYREFAVVQLQSEAKCVVETYSLASSASTFKAALNDATGFAEKHDERFIAFLQRALLYGAPLASPEAVAAFMASCAREAKARIEDSELPALQRVRTAMESALNLSFETSRGDAFFRSSLVQTLFYGVFSAWILWGRDHSTASSTRFDWRLATHYIRVPVLRSLFYELAHPDNVEPLGLNEPLQMGERCVERR